jgi:hypothetical protein
VPGFVKNDRATFDHFFDRADANAVRDEGVGREFQNDEIGLLAGVDAADGIGPIEGAAPLMVIAVSASSLPMTVTTRRL